MAHVTVPEADTRKIYTVDGTPETAFTISATFYNESTDIEVYVDGILRTSGVTITGTAGTEGGFQGGTATLSPGVSNATVITNVNIPIARTTDQPNSADFSIEAMNTEFDKFTTYFQQFADQIKRCLKLPVTSSLVDGSGNALDLSIPNPTANSLIGWNASANALTNITLTSLSLTSLDTVFSGLADNDFFVYDGTDTRWENRTPAQVRTILSIGDLAALKTTYSLGDIVESNIADFATAAQGAKADTALQTSDIGTQAQLEAETSGKLADASNVKFHPGVAKAWVKFSGSDGSLEASYNITSVTRNSAGNYTITIDTDFSSANYACVAMPLQSGAVRGAYSSAAAAAGTFVVSIVDGAQNPADATSVMAIFFGDQ